MPEQIKILMIEDVETDVWSGVLPMQVVAGTPVPDDNTGTAAPVPGSITPWRRP